MAVFIHPRLVIRLRLGTKRLRRPIPVFNVDGTPNQVKTIEEKVFLRYRWNDTMRVTTAYVASIGKQDLILGYNWLKRENPRIDWKKSIF